MSLGIGLSATVAGVLWFSRIARIGFLSDDLVQLSELAADQAPPAWEWFGREYYGFYRPLTALAWRLQYLVWGMNPVGYRLVNLLIHGICAAGVLALGRRLGLDRRAAFLASLVFLLDPGPVSAVLSIAGMTGLLSAALYLGAVVAHLRTREGHPESRGVSLVLFALALLTKETALSLPLAVFAIHWMVLDRRWRVALQASAPYLAVLLAYLGLRWFLFGHLAPAGLAQRSVDPIILTTNLVLYAATPVLPWGWGPLKPFFRGSPVLLEAVAALILAALAVTIVRLWRHRCRTPLFLGAWVALTAGPVLGFYSPWNAYLPAAGVALLLGGAFTGGPGRGDALGSHQVEAPSWAMARRAGAAGWLVLAVAFQVLHAGEWVEASALRDRVLAEATRAAEEEPGPWCLAGVPGEYRDVPVFGGAWGMTAALELARVERLPVVLPAVHLSDRRSGVTARVDGDGRIYLATRRDGDFFRLDPVAVLARDVAPRAGYSYATGAFSVRVTAANTQGQPSALEVMLADGNPAPRVLAWDDTGLVTAEVRDW
ncbi:MAG: hypothetical protein WDA75_20840 [Candidatus Latescibacterota bacterium]